MANGTPSMIALLGLLAVAGFQNREKLGQLLGQATGQGGNSPLGGGQSVPGNFGMPGANQNQAGSGGPLGGLLGNLGGMLGGGSAGSVVSGGLGDLLNHFEQNGHGAAASSWVKDGPTPIATGSLQQAIGPDVLAKLAQQTGLSQDELLSRLSQELPKAVDGLTPDSRVPNESEAGKLFSGIA